MSQLVRQPVETTRETSEEFFGDLYNEAKELLNYSVEIENTQLEKTLAQLNIQPFTQASVDNYKYWSADFKNLKQQVFTFLSFVVFLISVTVVITAFILSITALESLQRIICGGITIVFLGIAIFCLRYAITSRPTLEWERKKLKDQKIPEFALQTAIEIKKLCPDAIFYVDELLLVKEVIDPFLVVSTNNDVTQGYLKYLEELENQKFYYIEVWNTPKFKQERATGGVSLNEPNVFANEPFSKSKTKFGKQ